MDTIQINKHLVGLKCFKGTFPYDKLPNIKYTERPLGIILNTDPANKPGEHWVALFISTDNKAEYFDSFGRKPININKFLKINNISELIYNKQMVQCIFSSNCGLYCILYLKTRCNGISFKDFLSIYSNDRCLNDLLTLQSIY